jgi:hypothetical protein
MLIALHRPMTRLRTALLAGVAGAAAGLPATASGQDPAEHSIQIAEPVRTESPAAGGAADPHPDLRRLSPDHAIWLDAARGEVIMGGVITLADGGIEVFACPERTKEHEAVVATRCPARFLHAGLLAIGLEPGSPVAYHPDYVPARGPEVAIRVRWVDAAGVPQECRAQEWVRNTKTGGQLAAEWVFAGSGFWRDPADGAEHYQADGGDMICVSNFPTALLDLPIKSSESNEALLFEVFAGRVPPRGTAVELVLSAVK